MTVTGSNLAFVCFEAFDYTGQTIVHGQELVEIEEVISFINAWSRVAYANKEVCRIRSEWVLVKKTIAASRSV